MRHVLPFLHPETARGPGEPDPAGGDIHSHRVHRGPSRDQRCHRIRGRPAHEVGSGPRGHPEPIAGHSPCGGHPHRNTDPLRHALPGHQTAREYAPTVSPPLCQHPFQPPHGDHRRIRTRLRHPCRCRHPHGESGGSPPGSERFPRGDQGTHAETGQD